MTPLLKTALSFAARGWQIVPLHNPTPTGCSCGKIECGNSSGKHPRLPKWQDAATTDPATIRRWWTSLAAGQHRRNARPQVRHHRHRMRLARGRGRARSPPRRREPADLPRGPRPAPPLPLAGRLAGQSRLPRRRDRGPHRQCQSRPERLSAIRSPNGAIYAWQNDGDPPPLPAALLARIRIQQPPPVPPTAVFTPPPPSGAADRARAYLKTVDPAVSGQGGHNQTFRAACVLVIRFNMRPEAAYPLLAEWNERCVPPWSDRDLRRRTRRSRQAGGAEG